MRIIAGKFRSRQLKSAKGLDLRPTSDRLRETLFDILGDRVAGSRFIDAFAGTGAVGIEALSRGARHVIFIEKHAATASLIKKNLAALEIQQARVLPIDALHALQLLANEPPAHTSGDALDIVFLDPPYDHAADYDRVLSFLGSATLLFEGGLVIAEHRRKFQLPEAVEFLQRVRVLHQGDAALSFYRLIKTPQANDAASQ
ncbi:MAG TPA: 16S rRNA (guanine(966)-N(2))-methyltransferase RsmD [Verrucomicrobiae bacterium]|nr:16S rRNA (guanine(966)-N(2))-methyltransferase RsmD [Verrucomicrobiae bacterium]